MDDRMNKQYLMLDKNHLIVLRSSDLILSILFYYVAFKPHLARVPAL